MTVAAAESPVADELAGYVDVFPRADQFAHFRAYVRGLRAAPGRKNVEAVAAAAGVPAQSLQHFVSHSPWPADALFAAYRRELTAAVPDPDAVWAVHELVFPKKGIHSAGVFRQFDRDAGRKVNCQLAVAVTRVGPTGVFPLAARLYLPASWLRDHPSAAVPPEYAARVSKAELAGHLLAKLAEEGPALPAVTLSDSFAGAAAAAGGQSAPEVRRLYDRLRSELGLGHFEGRTWTGWHHHVALVFSAIPRDCGNTLAPTAEATIGALKIRAAQLLEGRTGSPK